MASAAIADETDAPIMDPSWPDCCGHAMRKLRETDAHRIFGCDNCQARETHSRGALRIVVSTPPSGLQSTLEHLQGRT